MKYCRHPTDMSASATELHCRLCAALLPDAVLDLGATPLANAYLRAEDLERTEP